MSAYSEILSLIREANSLREKEQLLTYLGRSLSVSKKRLLPADRRELGDFAVDEMARIPDILDKAADYREKDAVFGIVDSLMNLVMLCFGGPANVPAEQLEVLKGSVERCNKERFLENAVDEYLGGKDGLPTAADMERILCMAMPLKDEFHKSMLWQGLIHYKDRVQRLRAEAKAVLVKYALSELDRCTALCAEGTASEDVYGNLEFISDAARWLMEDRAIGDEACGELIRRITALFSLERPAVSFFALSTLLAVGADVSDGVIRSLAENIEYADRVYHMLKQRGMTSRFPAELQDPVYLAKSDMVQWLAYPTELGKRPDEIEYLGRTKKKGEIFHIFRYKSDSENLDSDTRNVWLIGWAGTEGGTFSNFDRYEDYERGTPEKTVKYIRKKIL